MCTDRAFLTSIIDSEYLINVLVLSLEVRMMAQHLKNIIMMHQNNGLGVRAVYAQELVKILSCILKKMMGKSGFGV